MIERDSWVIVVAQMAELFEVDVVFGTYDDSSSPNALASPSTTLLKKRDGTLPKDGSVMFGRSYLQIIRQLPNATTAMTAVCAHEFGHILQYKNDFALDELVSFFLKENTKIRAELHADFVCGYYGAVRKRVQRRYPAEIQALTEFNSGDPEGAALNHGTPEQRGKAVNNGFLLGSDGNTYSPREIVAKGMDYVRALSLH